MRYAAERSLEFFHPVPVKGREETRTPGMPEEREDVPLNCLLYTSFRDVSAPSPFPRPFG